MPKGKRVQLSSTTLLQARNQFLTNGVEPLHSSNEPPKAPALSVPPTDKEELGRETTVEEETPTAIVRSSVVQSLTQPRHSASRQTEPRPDESFAQDDDADKQAVSGPGLSKKALIQHYLELPKDTKNTADTVYLPEELYDVFITVWHQRKRHDRGVKKSHLIIEALLSHPEIMQELRQRKILK
jgi:hypothetical protein